MLLRTAISSFCAVFVLVLAATPARATPDFFKTFTAEYLQEHPDEAFAAFARTEAKCNICHQGTKGKLPNVYGQQLAELVDAKLVRKDTAAMTAALQAVAKLPADPADPDGETFGQRIAAGKLPGGELAQLQQPAAPNAVDLFDGKTLDGWIGAIDSYEVRDGAIVTLPGHGGNLLTKNEYADFVLWLEFRLPPGGNSGVGIRAPLEGDAAYQGMEIQVLDDTADKYADLQPYQFHGSIYGVAPAERGRLRPVGQWNREEIRCVGRHVTVKLNGKTIVDVDLDEAAPGGKTIDGNDHPGLKRRAGHIGLLGHGDAVAFRKIMIDDLSKTSGAQAD